MTVSVTYPVGFQSRARSLTEDFAYLSQVSLTDFFDMVLQLISSLAINYQYLFFSLYSKYCKTWYQLLVAKLLYCNPAVKSFDLQYHTQVCNCFWLND